MRAGQKTEKKPRNDENLMPGTFPGGGTVAALFSEKCKKRRKPCKRRTKFKRTAYAVSVTENGKRNVRLQKRNLFRFEFGEGILIPSRIAENFFGGLPRRER